MTTDLAPEPRDASEVGSQAAHNAWAEAARPILIEAAGRYRATVSYKNLAAAVQESTGISTTTPMHRWISDVLRRVAEGCAERGEPFLSSLCVSAQGGVGPGYADAVEDARGERPEDPDEHAAAERLECYRRWDAEGLPRDGGTPLRTAHFTPAKKAGARKTAARTGTTPRKAPAKKAVAAPVPEAKPIPLCPKCFTQVPATGVCDYCD